ncbi:hypothetical protein ACTXT7_011642 [Hymenolepis weldensis]
MSGCSNSSATTSTTTTTSLLSTELDCCVIPVRNNLKLIQTTDFFYANVDDPYTVFGPGDKVKDGIDEVNE